MLGPRSHRLNRLNHLNHLNHHNNHSNQYCNHTRHHKLRQQPEGRGWIGHRALSPPFGRAVGKDGRILALYSLSTLHDCISAMGR
jgi:hypothetical protein